MMVDEQISPQQPIFSQPVIQTPLVLKSHVWIWWLVGVIVLIVLGIGAWILLSSGSSIPQPPALPSG